MATDESKLNPNGRKAKKRAAWKANRELDSWWIEFCELLSSGRGTLTHWLDELDIPRSSYFRYVAENPSRKAQVTAALESIGYSAAQAASEAVANADLSDPKMLRLFLEQKRWEASKYAPQTYGERQKIDITHNVNPKSHLQALRELAQKPQIIELNPIEEHGNDSTQQTNRPAKTRNSLHDEPQEKDMGQSDR